VTIYPIDQAQTVLGAINPSDLGITLTHEHLLIDLAFNRPIPDSVFLKKIYYEPLNLGNLGYIKHFGIANRDDLQLLDINTAIDEINLYKKGGGNTVVDATSIGISRNPKSLYKISKTTGLHIIMGSSYYVDASHPPEMTHTSENQIYETIINDIAMGVEGTGIKSGLIGEVGCSYPLTDNERKVLQASGKAQKDSGAPLLIHPGRHENSPMEIIEILQSTGANLTKTMISHIDRTVFNKDNLKAIVKVGCYLEWDLFGSEQSQYVYNPKIDMPSDASRMDTIDWAISEGLENKIVISQDICHKKQLIKYGGHGYNYILGNIVPRMRNRGFTEDSINKFLKRNPAKFLTFSKS
tara:strand:+ start:38810 stop:39868 length:1059 start_codon:yes stop_codon:yes gene_type:complete